jgi:hypothetical protein
MVVNTDGYNLIKPMSTEPILNSDVHGSITSQDRSRWRQARGVLKPNPAPKMAKAPWPDPYEQHCKLERYIGSALAVMHPEDKPKLLRLLALYTTTMAECLEKQNEQFGVPDRDTPQDREAKELLDDIFGPEADAKLQKEIYDETMHLAETTNEPAFKMRAEAVDVRCIDTAGTTWTIDNEGNWKIYVDNELVCGPKPIYMTPRESRRETYLHPEQAAKVDAAIAEANFTRWVGPAVTGQSNP